MKERQSLKEWEERDVGIVISEGEDHTRRSMEQISSLYQVK